MPASSCSGTNVCAMRFCRAAATTPRTPTPPAAAGGDGDDAPDGSPDGGRFGSPAAAAVAGDAGPSRASTVSSLPLPGRCNLCWARSSKLTGVLPFIDVGLDGGREGSFM